MTRETSSIDKVALLATGDEILNGDILNTNAAEISQRLFNQGIPIGMQMVCSDSTEDIKRAITFLLQSHRALIITGGLGPTSDDLTRFALAEVLKRELIFDEPTWQVIIERFERFKLGFPPDNNRQQALFPSKSTIIMNTRGSAAGCMIKENNQLIFMLPGPPAECLPMVEQTILPALISEGLQHTTYFEKWLLFGVSEGHIAETLDAIAQPFNCVTGYRLWYPYVEFKIYAHQEIDFKAVTVKIKETITPYLIGDGKKSACEWLKEYCLQTQTIIHFHDHATGGLLESILKTPQTVNYLIFNTNNNDNLRVTINGLDDFWQENNSSTTTLELIFTEKNKKHSFHKEIPFRGIRVKQYAVEWICRMIYEYLVVNKLK